MAIGLSLTHNVDTLDALLIATRFFEVIFLTRLRLEKPTPSDGLREVSMHAVHELMESDWRRVNATESARISGLWITKRVDPGHGRQPAWSSECHVDVLVVQIMYAFAAEVSMHAVVPRCIPWTGTDTSDKLLYFILKSVAHKRRRPQPYRARSLRRLLSNMLFHQHLNICSSHSSIFRPVKRLLREWLTSRLLP